MTRKEEIENNYTYHPPKEGQPDKYTSIRNTAKDFALLINALCPVSVAKDTALQRLDEAVMWANASIARNE